MKPGWCRRQQNVRIRWRVERSQTPQWKPDSREGTRQDRSPVCTGPGDGGLLVLTVIYRSPVCTGPGDGGLLVLTVIS
ncbi:hypothetical protein ACOMHN_003712 [Nucella lapillus]